MVTTRSFLHTIDTSHPSVRRRLPGPAADWTQKRDWPGDASIGRLGRAVGRASGRGGRGPGRAGTPTYAIFNRKVCAVRRPCGLFVYLQMALGIVKCDSGHGHGPFVALPWYACRAEPSWEFFARYVTADGGYVIWAGGSGRGWVLITLLNIYCKRKLPNRHLPIPR